MSFLIYQRSDPRCQDWAPLVTQQIRLRNVIQIIGLNLELGNGQEEVYFTLHARATSTPFFTSDKLKGGKRVLTWKEIEPRQFGDNVRLSAPGCIIQVWSTAATTGGSSAISPNQQPITSWCVFFNGLVYLGSKGDWNTRDFLPNTLLFRMPFGFFTSIDSLVNPPISSTRFVQLQSPSASCKESYTKKSLAALHGVQRSVLDETETARKLKSRITLYGYSADVIKDTNTCMTSSLILGEKALTRIQQGKTVIQLKETIEAARQRVTILREEKQRALDRCSRLKRVTAALVETDLGSDLLSRIQSLSREKERYQELKAIVQNKRQQVALQRSRLFLRRRQLISELLLIYPLALVSGSKRYSVNEVQLPNAEDYGSEVGGQISVALGYTAHFVAMLSFFLGIPLRYPIRHFGSRSRIVDHITVQIPDKEREFPLYFAGKEDVYSKYAVYLLNKNIAQLRWFCGLQTNDLRATLPNLHSLLTTRLTIPGWPPSPGESLELAQELTEEVDQQLMRNEFSISLDKGLDQLDPPPKAFDNAFLRTSISNFECAGANSVLAGEVRHGRAQDRFLNGWRKKTYESEVIDSSWLTNSLNLEFDGGRRLSSISNPSMLLRPNPTILVSDNEKAETKQRRHGRVENFHHGPEPEALKSTGTTPNDSLTQLENRIKVLERRRSFCGDSGRNSSEGTPSPTHSNRAFGADLELPPANGMEKDELQDREADRVRRMSLVEMQNQRRKISTESTRNDSPAQEVVLEGIELSTEHLSPRYDHSSDERASPSPTPNSSQNLVESEVISAPELSQPLKAWSLFPGGGDSPNHSENPDLLSADSIDKLSNANVPLKPNPQTDFTMHVNENISNNFNNYCDNVSNCRFEEDDADSSSALWLRTEALEALLSSQSFNQVKRRVSESK